MGVVEGVQASGATSLWQIVAALNERHIRTARGKEWTATQVMRVLGQGKSPVGIPLNGAEFTEVVCLFTHKMVRRASAPQQLPSSWIVALLNERHIQTAWA